MIFLMCPWIWFANNFLVQCTQNNTPARENAGVLAYMDLLQCKMQCVRMPKKPLGFFGSSHRIAFVFFSCCDPAADVPFGFVLVEDLFDLHIQRAVTAFQPFGQVLVHG